MADGPTSAGAGHLTRPVRPGRLPTVLARSWKWILLACAPVAIAGSWMDAGAVPVFLLSAAWRSSRWRRSSARAPATWPAPRPEFGRAHQRDVRQSGGDDHRHPRGARRAARRRQGVADRFDPRQPAVRRRPFDAGRRLEARQPDVQSAVVEATAGQMVVADGGAAAARAVLPPAAARATSTSMHEVSVGTASCCS